MPANEQITILHRLEDEAATIRKSLQISPPGTVLYKAEANVAGDETVVVEADGFGGATVSVVEGNFPVDYCIRVEKGFATEAEAVVAADEIVVGGAPQSRVLTGAA